MFLVKFLASTPGRWVRVAAGLAIIGFGLASLSQKEHCLLYRFGTTQFQFCSYRPDLAVFQGFFQHRPSSGTLFP